MCEACAHAARPVVCADPEPASRPRLRFPKAARLSSSREFQRVREDGRAWGGPFFVLSVLPTGEGGESRVGIITSRRVGGAVTRVRVRRLLRETVRPTRPMLRPGCWIVLIARHTAGRADLAKLTAEWFRLGRKAGILPREGMAP